MPFADQVFPQALHPIALPLELIDALNQEYFLHLLATEPDKVISPGKSLLSMLAHSRVTYGEKDESSTEKESLDDKIRQVAYKAFWDQALEKLLSPQPSVQLQRLRLLYLDLKDALAPLFPLNHPAFQTLSLPLAPTTSPLYSATLLLKEVLIAVKRRCAPSRDQAVDKLLLLLNEIHPPSVITDSSLLQKRNHSLAPVVINAIQSTLALAEAMKEDLNYFVLGAMTETQLKAVIRQQAKTRERELVLKLWSTSHSQGQQVVRERWRIWAEQLDSGAPIGNVQLEDKWKFRLLQALRSTTPVSCVAVPSGTLASGMDMAANSKILATPPNSLPPQFLFTAPRLVTIQNYMQALVITASLRSLLRVPALRNSFDHSQAAVATDFTQRVWSILAGDIEIYQSGQRPPDVGETRTAHLVDELVRARREMSEMAAAEGKHIRTAAENLLQPKDPVYLLLLQRISEALIERLLASRPSTPIGKETRSQIPEKLKTGKDLPSNREGKRPKLDLPSVSSSNLGQGSVIGMERFVAPPKGFEDPTLAFEVNQLSLKFASCVVWVEEVWGDLV